MGLISGSNEYYKIKEQAERAAEKRDEAWGYDEKKRYTERCNDLADRIRETYGFDDPEANYIIDFYHLDSN